MVECHECGLFLRARTPPPGGKAKCPRCGATLYRNTGRSLDHAIALNITGLVLLAIANIFPFMSFKLEGREQISTLITGVMEFLEQGLWPLAALVFAVTILIPFAKLVGTLCVLVPVRRGRRPRARRTGRRRGGKRSGRPRRSTVARGDRRPPARSRARTWRGRGE
jgi:paraquat-inducible protein A